MWLSSRALEATEVGILDKVCFHEFLVEISTSTVLLPL
jgi:hypothetical protein